ncbi:MAG TPA: Sec-independent protein translocase protein TatB [Sphingomicrobium sp.]|nr:Sec-independent protein translocase protein TatB [Sphingomicrobium sp.]
MFGFDTSELIIVAILALIFIGPKELPGTMRTVGRWIGQVRGMARHFQSGIEAAIREAELEEMERKWREENDRIMREFPQVDGSPSPTQPAEVKPEVETAQEEPQLPLPEPPKRELP